MTRPSLPLWQSEDGRWLLTRIEVHEDDGRPWLLTDTAPNGRGYQFTTAGDAQAFASEKGS
jgi:hypothetical protein